MPARVPTHSNVHHDPPASAGVNDHPAHRPGDWTVVLFLTEHCPKTWAAAMEQLGTSLLDHPDGPAFCLRAEGTMDVALTTSMADLKRAADDNGLSVDDITEVRMISVDDAHRSPPGPLQYYNLSQSAAALGVSRQRARQLLENEELPPADAVVGTSPLWERTAFDRFARGRSELVGRMASGLNWRFDPSAAQALDRLRARADDTAILLGGRRASIDEIHALRDQLSNAGNG